MVYPSLESKSIKLIERERLILIDINTDKINSASAFVDYLSEAYGFSKSSVWYNLNKLKEKRLIDFASKDYSGKPLELTNLGVQQLRYIARRKNSILEHFSNQEILVEMQ